MIWKTICPSMKSLILAKMNGQDSSNLIYYYKRLVEDWFKIAIDHSPPAYKDKPFVMNQLPYHIQDGIKLLDSYGHRFDIATQRFIP